MATTLTRLSYFQKLRELDFTIGHRTTVPASLDDALGRAIVGEEPQQCFGCSFDPKVITRLLHREERHTDF